MRFTSFLALSAVAAAGLAACGGGGEPAALVSAAMKSAPAVSFGQPQPNFPVSFEGITPTPGAGNFVASDNDQVCYELSRLGVITEVTGEMRGIKVDPGANYSSAAFAAEVDGTGRYLAWATSAAQVLAIIVKGGPNYHVYDYTAGALQSDSWLASPRNGRNIPAISHYNVCYQPVVAGGDQGCTPGYWRNHADRWEGVQPGAIFDVTFGVTLLEGSVTLGQAINNPQTYGTFATHAVAALLNSYGGTPNPGSDPPVTVQYAYTTAQVLQMVQDAVAGGAAAMEAAKDLLEAANEAGCPLEGTRAVRVN